MNFQRLANACKHRKEVSLDVENRYTELICTFVDTSEIDKKYCNPDETWKEPWGKNQTAWLEAEHRLFEKSRFKCSERKCPLLKEK